MEGKIGRSISTLVGAAVALLSIPAPAGANDHLLNVGEVFAGTVGQPNAEFVELQMRAAGQPFVAGNRVRVYNASGTLIATLPADVSNGANQSSILFATNDAAVFFGVAADLAIPPGLPPGGGQVCYEDIDGASAGFIDCASWGSFSAPPPSGSPGAVSGPPFNPSGGILSGLSANRDITGGSSPVLLDAADDTNNSAADFDALALAGPRNNAGATSTTGQASVAGGVLGVTTAPGTESNVDVTLNGGFYNVRDLEAPVAAGPGCIQSKTNVARCSAGPITSINVDAGDLNDRGTIGDNVDAFLGGGTGDDTLISKNGEVSLDGGGGIDTLQPGTGADSIAGGIGADTVTYADRGTEEAVTVDIDGAADDGNVDDLGTSGGDNVQTDVERIVGGAGGDVLRGSSIANRLTGGGGQDELRGLAGIDTIFAAGDGQIDNVLCGGGSADHAFADPTDTVATSGPERCELVN